MPYRTVTSSRTLVLWWVGSPAAAEIDALVHLLSRAAEAEGALPHYVCVISNEARPPDPAGRAAFLARAEDVMARCEHFHLVLEANPFLNAIARGLVATASLLPRFRGRVTVHDTLDDAIAAVPPNAGGGRALAELVRASSAEGSSRPRLRERAPISDLPPAP